MEETRHLKKAKGNKDVQTTRVYVLLPVSLERLWGGRANGMLVEYFSKAWYERLSPTRERWNVLKDNPERYFGQFARAQDLARSRYGARKTAPYPSWGTIFTWMKSTKHGSLCGHC